MQAAFSSPAAEKLCIDQGHIAFAIPFPPAFNKNFYHVSLLKIDFFPSKSH